MTNPIRPPFKLETALAKVHLPPKTPGTLAIPFASPWPTPPTRSGATALAQFVSGRPNQEFLAGKWQRELDYRLVKELCAWDERPASRCVFPVRVGTSTPASGSCSYGNELWEFDDDGLMRRREASINDVAIAESDRKFFWPAPGPRPADHPGIPGVE